VFSVAHDVKTFLPCVCSTHHPLRLFYPTRNKLRSILSFGGVLSFGRVKTLAAASFMGEGLPPLALPPPVLPSPALPPLALPPPVHPSPALQASLAHPAPQQRSPPVVDSAAPDKGVFEAPLFVDGATTNPALERDPKHLYTGAASSFSDPVHGWRGE
jgi:hypothetical protein